MPRSEANAPATLRRTANRVEIVGLALNDVIGSGVYLLPAAAAALLGFASLWAVGLAALAVLMIVLCFAEASSYFDEPGGAYLYARTAFGDFVGFQVGWMTWLARVASIASLSVGLVEAASFLLPSLAEPGLARQLAIGLPIVALGMVNLVGVRAGISTSVVLVVGKLVPLVVFIGVGIFFASPATAFAQKATLSGGSLGGGGLGQAALLLLFAYAGFENTPSAAGEFKNPRRDVPRALVLHLAVVSGIYLLAQWVALGTLPELGTSSSPLAEAASGFLGPWGSRLLAVGAVVAILGTNANTMLFGPRYLFALALDGYGPRALARVHPRFRTPSTAILVQTVLAVPLALSGSFVGLAALSVVARLTTYIGTAASLPRLRQRALAQGQGDGWQLPFGRLIPTLAIAVSIGLLLSAEASNLIATVGALAVGTGLYKLRTRPPAAKRQ